MSATEGTKTEPKGTPRVVITPEAIARAVDNALLSCAPLLASLKTPPPFGAFEANGVWKPSSMTAGIKHYGTGPLFGLWLHCRDMVALRVLCDGGPGDWASPVPAAVVSTEEPLPIVAGSAEGAD